MRESQDFSYSQAQAVCIQCTKRNQQKDRGLVAQVEGIMHLVTKANDIPESCFLAATLRGSSDNKFWSNNSSDYYYCPNANTNVRRVRMLFNKSNKSLNENIGDILTAEKY